MCLLSHSSVFFIETIQHSPILTNLAFYDYHKSHTFFLPGPTNVIKSSIISDVHVYITVNRKVITLLFHFFFFAKTRRLVQYTRGGRFIEWLVNVSMETRVAFQRFSVSKSKPTGGIFWITWEDIFTDWTTILPKGNITEKKEKKSFSLL